MSLHRCAWAGEEGTKMCRYHDEEWGSEEHDDKKLFSMLLLESFQAGLSWSCILNKREGFARAFDGFDYEKIARYDDAKVEELMGDRGIVRCRRKILAAIGNAQAFLKIRKEFGSFDRFLWSFAPNGPIRSRAGVSVVSSPLSDSVSKALKKRGMKYVGTVIVYSYLQTVGVIDDHEEGCFCAKRTENGETPVA